MMIKISTATLVLVFQLLLEVTTLIGLFGVLLTSVAIFFKILLLILSMGIVYAWFRYGLASSSHVLKGWSRLGLDVALYAVSNLLIFFSYGKAVSIVYLLAILVKFILTYLLEYRGKTLVIKL